MSIASADPGERKRRTVRAVGYTVDEVAGMLRISRNAAYEMVSNKQIPSVKVGRLIRVPAGRFHELFGERNPD